MSNLRFGSRFFKNSMMSAIACTLFASTEKPAALAGIFTGIHVGKWTPSGQDVVVGVTATLPNTCTLFDGIESDIVLPKEHVPGQVNIRVTFVTVPYNVESEQSGKSGCRNEVNYVYEKINFGPLVPGPYQVRLFENGVLGITKMLNVSEFPMDPIFSEPGGFYNIGLLLGSPFLVAAVRS